MKKALTGKKNILLMILIVIIIMGASVSFRLLVNRDVTTKLGESRIDPETGVPYLTEMDSYYHLRMTRDLAEYGHAGDTEKDGEPWDSFSYAPEGRSADGYMPLMAYIAIFLQKILSGFGITLEQVAYWQGMFISALVVIPVFVIAYRAKGIIAGVVASLLSSINYGYFVHTVPGFYDTDTVISWTSCFLFCSAILFVDALGRKEEEGKGTMMRKRICYAVLFVLSLLLLAASWYIFYMFAGIVAIALIITMILDHLNRGYEDRQAYVKRSIPYIVFIAATAVISLIAKPDLLSSLYENIISVFSKGDSLFPNALVSVSEMRKPSLIAGGLTGFFQMRVLSDSNIGIINAVGGMIPCAAAIAMCVLIIRALWKKDIRFEYVLLVIWFLITAVLAVRSWRFIMLFAVPVAILAGMLTGTLCSLMKEKKMMDWGIFAGMIVILMIFPATYGAYRSSLDSVPTVNRPMHETLTYIRDNTPENTVVAGWWDYGYFFEEKTGRRVLFDGGSQTGQRVFWMGKAFATDNEELSANIVKMLAGSGDEATDRMLEVFGRDKTTLTFMEELLGSGKEQAGKMLKGREIGADEADELLSLLFPESTDPVLLAVTRDMPSIAGWFSEFGSWNEDEGADDKEYMILIDRTEFPADEEKCMWDLARDEGNVRFTLEKEGDDYSAYFTSENEGVKPPYSVDKIYTIKNGELNEKIPEDAAAASEKGVSVVLYLDSDRPNVSLLTDELADSVFGHMYYLGGWQLSRYSGLDAPGSAVLFSVD
ncbi:MAG: dolichyl-diphosphooligosaccharide--protein glycosyltransferase subunit STT3 [Lachnospiraceae bacterium]|nr:dolichyl-diphosphooligosaccharide--protein glycosyltransferase subunit STT3 [Lachnospiraceae bacterium]